MIRKAPGFFKLIGLFLLSIPLFLLIVLVRPFKLIRVGGPYSQRIGHLTLESIGYLLNRENQNCIDIIFCRTPIANVYLKNLLTKHIRFWPFPKLFAVLRKECEIFNFTKKHIIDFSGLKNLEGIYNHKSFLVLSDNIKSECRRKQLQLGIPLGSKWICIHNRDSAYLSKHLPGDWSYHDPRDFSVNLLLKAAGWLTSQGYYVVRMGSCVKEKIKTINPMIIDYANSTLASEIMDVFLLTECEAYFGSDSGIFAPALAAKKPIFFINYSFSSLYVILIQNCYKFPLITKKYRCKKTNKLLSLDEIYKKNLHRLFRTEEIQRQKVKIEDNSETEILLFAKEMISRLNNMWRPSKKIIRAQRKVFSLIKKYENISTPTNPINTELFGAHYLLKNVKKYL